MRHRTFVRTLGLSLALAVVFVTGQAYQPALSVSGLDDAALQVPGPGAGPSPEPSGKPEARGDIEAEQGPSDAGAEADPRQLPPHARGPGREIEPRRYPDPAAFGREKSRANANANANARKPGSSTTGAVAPSARFATLGYTGWNPPDGGLAVGPTSVLVAVNEAFAVYDRSGKEVVPSKGLPSFFGTKDSVFDPRALYDAGRNRFVMLAVAENSRTRTSSFRLAVSRTNDAAGGWCTYALNAVTGSGGSASWADFPGLGMDGNNLYLTSNQFSFSRSAFQYARILAVPKSSVYPPDSGSCPKATSWDFRDLRQPNGSDRSFTVQPAHQPDGAGSGAMHFVNALWPSGNNLVVRSMNVPTSGAPTLRASYFVDTGFIGQYTIPADAPQPGGSAIDTGDTRLTGAVFRYGRISTTNTTQAAISSTPNGAANVQWYEITPRSVGASSGSSGQTYAVADAATAYYFPAVLPACGDSACTGGAALVFSGSGPDLGASAFAATTADGRPSIRQFAGAEGASGYTLNGRWGDYHAVVTDPTDQSAVWLLGQYAASANAWGTAVERVTVPAP